MKRFISAVVFCSSLLVVLSFVLVRTSRAKEDVIQALLDLPAPPPPNPLVPQLTARTPEFFSKKNPPKDDAPIEDLLDYWRHQSENYRELAYNPLPSARTLERLMGEFQKQPETALGFMQIFKDSPRAAEFLKEIYDNSEPGGEETGARRSALKKWLKYNSPHFGGELSRTSERIHDADEYLTDQDDLLALGRHDWERAKGHVNKLYGDTANPTSQVLAKWVLYRRALSDDSLGDIDRYRDELKAVVENKSATHGQRDLALDALLKEKDWSGRDDWYFSLFEDETLADLRIQGRSYTGLTTLIYYSPPGKHADKMIELSKSTNPHVRAAAVRNLSLMIDEDRPEVVRALLPWLENPKWARDIDGARGKVVQALQKIKMPESVTGLLAVLDEKETRSVPNYNSNMANVSSYTSNINTVSNTFTYASNSVAMNSNSTRMTNTIVYPHRTAAVDALGHQGDMRAAPALRRVFAQVEQYQRGSVVRAIFNTGGFTIAEQLDALEAAAEALRDMTATYATARQLAEASIANIPHAPDGDDDEDDDAHRERRIVDATVGALSHGRTFRNESDLRTLLGSHIAQVRSVSDDLARAAIKRIEQLDKTDPELAAFLRQLVGNWNSQFINAFMLNDVKNGKAAWSSIVRLLTIRKELREKQMADISSVRSGGGAAGGFAACLTEADGDYAAVLAGQNVDAKKAMLACGRLIRAHFPVPEIARLLQSTDKQLALAAERYLESEDSPEARRIVLSLHPNEAKILGATVAFPGSARSLGVVPVLTELFASVSGNAPELAGEYGHFRHISTSPFETRERRLQKELLANADLLGVYSYGPSFVRIYKDKAVFSWEEDESRYRERTLESPEFDELKTYLARNNVDSLAPFLSCQGGCEAQELVMLSKAGGRRVFFYTTKKQEFESGLVSIFDAFKRPPTKLRYWLEKDVPGLEILFADDQLAAHAVWKNGADMRLLIADARREKEIKKEIDRSAEGDEDEETDEEEGEGTTWKLREQRKFDHFAWHRFDGGVLGETAPQPLEVEYIRVKDSITPPAGEEQWKARAGNVEIRADEKDGLFKVIAGRSVKIGSGTYSTPVLSSDGKWAIAYKGSEDDEATLVRVNLLTGREYKIVSEAAKYASPVVYVASVNRFLIGHVRGEHDYESERSGTDNGDGRYFWLDGATGAVQPATGELGPLGQQLYRPLQPTGGASEFWAAIPNAQKNETLFGIYNTRTFKMTPLLKLPKIQFNSQVMWVDAGKLYFVYDGHVLSVPFKR